MAGFKKHLTELKYRMRIRNVLQNATDEELKITHEETIKERERRNRKQ